MRGWGEMSWEGTRKKRVAGGREKKMTPELPAPDWLGGNLRHFPFLPRILQDRETEDKL